MLWTQKVGLRINLVEAEGLDEKLYPTINFEDNFVENTVIIVLDKENEQNWLYVNILNIMMRRNAGI